MMHNFKSQKKGENLLSFVAFTLVFIPNFVLAYTPLVTSGPLAKASTDGDLMKFLVTVFNWGIGLAVALSVLFIILGGIQYMTTDAIYSKEEGRQKITAALAGLLIALSSWLILNQINPDILKKNNLTLNSDLINGAKGPVTPQGGLIPEYHGSEQFIASGDPYNPTLTAYSPQKGGGLVGMEGGYASSRPGLDGLSIVRTLDDYASGKSSYVTLAGDSSQYGKGYTIPTITYKNNTGQLVTLTNVKGYVHDTGGAFTNAGSTKFDVPIGRDYTDYQMNTQPFNGNNVQFIPSNVKK
jgi:hypothetical protein